jgi:hypothetical protein
MYNLDSVLIKLLTSHNPFKTTIAVELGIQILHHKNQRRQNNQ